MKTDLAERRGLTRRVVRWLVGLYYPRLEIVDAERIPQQGPVLLCANHANSLLDPVLVGIIARRPVRFMAKAPLFKHPIVGPPMKALGMVPAFRGSDDASQVRRNLESLNVAARVLADGHAMGIFPEGKSTDHQHLEMLRSGAARMALQAVELGACGLQVVPVGLTYERKEQFRSGVLARIGRPIDVAELLAQYAGDSHRARRALTDALEARLRDVVVHLSQPEWEPWLEDLESILPPPADAADRPARRLWQRKRLADAMNYFWEHDRPQAEAVAAQLADFRRRVSAAGLTVDSPVLQNSGAEVAARLLASTAYLLLLMPIALLGAVMHLLPFVTTRAIASRMDQPGRLTKSTHRLMVGVPVYLAWYLLVAVLLGLWRPWWGWSSLVWMPLAGLGAWHYVQRAAGTATLLFHQLQCLGHRQRLRSLRGELDDLRQRLAALLEQYNAQASGQPVVLMPDA